MFIHLWHSMLDMPKHEKKWHEQDIQDELRELSEAGGRIARWSEKSDVVYTYTRGRWSGHDSLVFPLTKMDFMLGALYMLPKYTSRWLFFYVLGKKFNLRAKVTEVRNPKKFAKLEDIARRYGLNPQDFERAAKRLARFWIFLP